MGMTILDSIDEIKYELPFKYKVTNFLRLTNIGLNKRGFLRKQYNKSDSSKIGSLNKLGIINYIISSIQKQLPDVNNKVIHYSSYYYVKIQSSGHMDYQLKVYLNLDKLSENIDNTVDYLNNVFSIILEDSKRSNLISYQVYYNIFGKPIYSIPRLTEEELSEDEIYDIVNISILDSYIGSYYNCSKEAIERIVNCYNELDEFRIKSFI